MEIIRDKIIQSIKYPTGAHIQENIPNIKLLAKAFEKIGSLQRRDLNIFCRGSSGAIIAALFSSFVPNKCQIIHVKKEGESSNHPNSNIYYDHWSDGANIIIDDFIGSGATINYVYQNAKQILQDIKIDAVVIAGDGGYNRLSFQPDYFLCRY